jgi:hypothetical protein
MWSTARSKAAATIVFAALLLVPAPLLPPLGFVQKAGSVLGISWKTAYLLTAIGLHVALYSSLGVVGAFAVRRREKRFQRLLQFVIVPLSVVGVSFLIRSVKLGYIPILANAIIPMSACSIGAITGLLFRQHGWRLTVGAMFVFLGGLLCAFWPGVASDFSRVTDAQLRRLVAVSPTNSSGDQKFGVLLTTVFAPMPSSSPQLDLVEHNRAAILALGIAIGHERLSRFAGLDRQSELVRTVMALRPGTSLRGREDWARHYCVSAALSVVENPFLSDMGGLIKEELDALTRGNGFSFGDLAADRAGVRFARAATRSELPARTMQERLQKGYSVDDFFPPASDLPENLTMEQFRRDYGGVGTQRYRRAVSEIEARLDRCPALAFQSSP